MKLHSEEAELQCRNCNWSGEVSRCPTGAESLNGDEDGPRARLCPQCNKPLAVQGWLDFISVEENAVVLDDGLLAF